MQIQDMVAVVSGGASGIGRASAERLKREGARVLIADVDRAAGAQTARELGVTFAPLDAGDPAAWAVLLDDVVAREGRLDLVHLNAGLLTPVKGQRGDLMTPIDFPALLDDDYRAIMRVNVDGVVFGARAAAQRMIAAGGGGALVATASIAGIIPFSMDPIYCLTKHAVVGLMRSLAPALLPHGITVNVVCPGVVRTRITSERVFEAVGAMGLAPMDPAQIADAVVQAVRSGETGQSLVCLPGREPEVAPVPEYDIRGAATTNS